MVIIPCFLFSGEFFFFSPEMIQSHVKNYNSEEMELITKDLEVVRSVCFKEETSGNRPLYLATAGGPGARKSTILERFLKEHSHELPTLTYLDPDPRGLKFMAHTYQALSLCPLEISKFPEFTLAQKSAYEKWRGASNYITLLLLEEAFLKRLSIAHGTTSTGEHIPEFLKKVKESGYDITLLLCSCEDEFRYKTTEYRINEQKFYQSSPEDVVLKGKSFPVRMSAYFNFADTLYLFWSDDLATKESLSAILQKGNIVIIDPIAYEKFVQKYENDRSKLQKEGKIISSWVELVKTYQKRF